MNLMPEAWKDKRIVELEAEVRELRYLLGMVASFDWDTLLAAAGGVPYSPKYECDWDEVMEQITATVPGDESAGVV